MAKLYESYQYNGEVIVGCSLDCSAREKGISYWFTDMSLKSAVFQQPEKKT